MLSKKKFNYKENKITRRVSIALASVFVLFASSCELINVPGFCSVTIEPEDAPESEDSSSSSSSSSSGEEEIPTFSLTDNGGSWSDQSNLNIFYNETFGSTMIAPGLSGTYTFNLTNTSSETLSFSISLTEENEFDIAMVYKLDRDNTALIDTYLRAADFKVEDEQIAAGTTSVFTLYWYWDPDVSDENDTKASQNQMTYSLTITIDGYIVKENDE